MTRSPVEPRPISEHRALDIPLPGSPEFSALGLTRSEDRGLAREDTAASRYEPHCSPARSRRSSSRPSGSGGLTVTELMVVLFFGMVMVALGARFLGDWYDQYRFSGLVRSVTTAIAVARARAVGAQSFGRLNLAQGPERLGASDSLLQDGGLLINPKYYKLDFRWSPKLTADSKPFYEVEIKPSYAPSTVTSTIWFNPQGFAIAPPTEIVNADGTHSYKQNGYATYQITIKGNAAKRQTSFTITPLGRVKQGASS